MRSVVIISCVWNLKSLLLNIKKTRTCCYKKSHVWWTDWIWTTERKYFFWVLHIVYEMTCGIERVKWNFYGFWFPWQLFNYLSCEFNYSTSQVLVSIQLFKYSDLLILKVLTFVLWSQVDHSDDRIRSNLSRFRYSFCRFRSNLAGSDRIRRIPWLRIPAGSSREISGYFLTVSGRTFVRIKRNQLSKRWAESGGKEIDGTEIQPAGTDRAQMTWDDQFECFLEVRY